MRSFLIIIFCLLFFCQVSGKEKLYLIPGLGSDQRIFERISFSTFDTTVIQRPRPHKHETMQAYAKRLITQIDTTESFSLMGVSHGGMLAVEIGKILRVKKIILISSAAEAEQLPFRYSFQQHVPVYKLFSGRTLKKLSFVAQPIFEPDSRCHKETCRAMLRQKDPYFLRRGTEMIVKWNGHTKASNIIQIHGSDDHTIPIKKVKYDFLVADGSHMMCLSRAEEISAMLESIFREGNMTLKI